MAFLPLEAMGLLPDTQNCGLRMRRECRERFPLHRFQRKLLVSDPDMHHGTCVTHVPWCMSGSLNRGGGGKGSRHSRRMRNSQFYVSGKRPIAEVIQVMMERGDEIMMMSFSALLALCVGNLPVTSEFPSHRSVTQRFDIFFNLRLE